MRLVIFGPQGAGKGTQSGRISEKYGIPSIATGDMFRWAIAEQTDVGRRAHEYVGSGRLVPDDVTIDVVCERLGSTDVAGGFLLDGFPRNISQAEALDGIGAELQWSLNAALALEVPEAESLKRIMGRRVCSQCGRNYHVDAPPRRDWTCDVCGGRVEPRPDDQDEGAIRERLHNYREQTEPLKSYYEERGKLRAVSGEGSPDEVFDRIVEVL